MRFLSTILLAILLTQVQPGRALAQGSAQLRVYVLRSGDDASDQAVKSALIARGHQVSLGVRAGQLDSAPVRLSDFHVVVGLGAEREGIRVPVLNMLARYLQGSGGLLVDGLLLYALRGDPVLTLRLPGQYCGWLQHPAASTTFERADPEDPVVHAGVPSSFQIEQSTLDQMNEQCLNPASGGTVLFRSKASNETRPRAGLLTNEPNPNSRAAVFSLAIRSRELRSSEFLQTFVNSVEWAGAKSQPTDPLAPGEPPVQRRVYVLRTGDDASDQAIVQALRERGHQVSLGVRAAHLSSAQVRLSDYHAVVALGSPREGPNAGEVDQLAKYVEGSGGLLTDGPMLYVLRGEPGIRLRLPAAYCGWLQHPDASTTLERIEPPDPIVHNGIPASIPMGLTAVDQMHEQCQNPSEAGKLMLYARAPEGTRPRPGVLVNEPGARSRIVSFSVAIRARELREASFRRLFVNSVEWASALSEPTEPQEQSPTSKPLRVYVLRTGEVASDDAIAGALRQRGHTVSLGVRTAELGAAPVLSTASYDAVVALGAAREGLSAAGLAELGRYLDSGGRLLVDGLFQYAARGNPTTVLRLPGEYCGWLAHPVARTSYERIDPPDAVLHKGIPPAFQLDLSAVDQIHEVCLNPAEGGKLMLYSRAPEGSAPRPGVLVNEPGPNSRIVSFSVGIRQRELRNPDFNALFVNAVEYVAGKMVPVPPIRFNPSELPFSFRTSADVPRAQVLQVTPTTLAPTTFTATASTSTGGDWLSVSPGSATAPANLSVRVAPVFLPPGVYTGQITLASGGAVLAVPVRVTVNGTAPCEYRVSPLSAAFPAAGGSNRIGVSAPPGCTWSATSSLPWIAISSGAAGAGSGTVSFTAAAAASREPRSGSLTIAGQSFAVTQSGTSLSFRLESSGLDVRLPEGAPQTETRLVSVIPSDSNPAFTASTTGGAWLNVAPSTGTAPGSLVVSINAGGLAAGLHRGEVIVRVPTATPPEQTLPVALTVEPSGAPKLTVEPSSVTLSATQGGEPRTHTLQISNRGRDALPFRAAVNDAPWLTVAPDSGSVSAASPASLVITGDPRSLQPGSYSGRIIVSSPTGEEAAVEVVMTVTAARQSILLSQSGLSYTAVVQGGRVPPQTFGVVNIGSGTMDWTASPTTLSGGSWLSLSSNRGASDSASPDVPLTEVNINAAGLNPGEYHGRITISSPTANNSPQIVSVILRVLPAGSDPGPVVRPTGLIFTGGSSQVPQDVFVSNLTGEPRIFNSNRLTTDNAPWFTHTPGQATVAPTQPTRIAVQPATGGLSPGVRRGVLTLLFNNGAVQHVNVLSIVPPQASPASKAQRDAASCASPSLVLTHTSLRQGFTASVGQGVAIEIKGADSCGNLLTPRPRAQVSVAVSFSTGDPQVNLVHIGGGVWSGTWRPVRPAAYVSTTVTAFSFEGASIQGGQVDLAGSVRELGRTPIVTAGGLVHGASLAAGVPLAPGTLFTVKGANLSDDTESIDKLPLPVELRGVEVLLGDRSLPLLFVSQAQVNVQVPFGLPVNTQHQISVRRGQELSVPETITVAEALPGIFTKNSSGGGQGSIFKGETTAVYAEPATPASSGEAILVLCTGLGGVDLPVVSGAASPAQPPARAVAPVEMFIGGRKAEIRSASLAPNLVGVYEIRAIVPDGVTPGDTVPVTIVAAGQSSLAVTMAIR